MKRQVYVIGDIHGALKALTQLMERLQPQVEDSLIFIGDYVDGWSESAQVIDYVMELSARVDCLFIKGNHDAWCEAWLDTRATDDLWLNNGGKATIESYKEVSDEKRAAHLAFFKRMKPYHIDEQGRLFIHAGFTSMFGPERETHLSNYFWDRTLWELALSTDSRIPKDSLLYPKRLKLYSEIFIGHTPTIQFDSDIPMQGSDVWNVDTGVAFTGKISALNIDTKEYWQSDTCQSLYPNEKGRNK